jgi:hypothetical protein
LNRGKKWLYYPLGGSWIAEKDWGIHIKTRDVSIIGTDKHGAEGHKLRHAIIDRFKDRLGVWGRGYNPMQSKYEALATYRYSIVVESIRMDDYFSEKLIDCLSVGTIPIYWGSPSVYVRFNPHGIIPFDNVDQLAYILEQQADRNYFDENRLYIQENVISAMQYMCAEDWIHKNYAFLFSG